MKIITAEPFSLIDLGHRGENSARCIAFDISEWIKIYGQGVAQLAVQLPSSSVPYPCAVTADGERLIWQITSADTSVAGKGKCELSYYVGEQLVKSCVYQTYISESLTEVGAVPEAQKAWVDEVLAAASRAVTAQNANENMSVSAKTTENTEAYILKTKKDGVIHLEFGIPKGEKGDDGYTPQFGVDYWTEEHQSAIAAVIKNLVGVEVKKQVGVIENGSY
jgi:hypothetical protein